MLIHMSKTAIVFAISESERRLSDVKWTTHMSKADVIFDKMNPTKVKKNNINYMSHIATIFNVLKTWAQHTHAKSSHRFWDALFPFPPNASCACLVFFCHTFVVIRDDSCDPWNYIYFHSIRCVDDMQQIRIFPSTNALDARSGLRLF